MFPLANKYYLIKTKKLKNLNKYYFSNKWIIFSYENNIIVKNNIYNSHHFLDTINYQEQFENTIINNVKVILIGKYHKIINIYHYLVTKNIKVYNIFL